MNLFDQLSKDLGSIWGNPQPIEPTYGFKLVVTHVDYGTCNTTTIKLPYTYTSVHNARLMRQEFRELSHEDILSIVSEHSNVGLGEIQDFLVL